MQESLAHRKQANWADAYYNDYDYDGDFYDDFYGDEYSDEDENTETADSSAKDKPPAVATPQAALKVKALYICGRSHPKACSLAFWGNRLQLVNATMHVNCFYHRY